MAGPEQALRRNRLRRCGGELYGSARLYLREGRRSAGGLRCYERQVGVRARAHVGQEICRDRHRVRHPTSPPRGVSLPSRDRWMCPSPGRMWPQYGTGAAVERIAGVDVRRPHHLTVQVARMQLALHILSRVPIRARARRWATAKIKMTVRLRVVIAASPAGDGSTRCRTRARPAARRVRVRVMDWISETYGAQD